MKKTEEGGNRVGKEKNAERILWKWDKQYDFLWLQIIIKIW